MSQPCPFFCKNGTTYKRTDSDGDFPSTFAHQNYVLGHNMKQYYNEITCPICHGSGTISDEDYAAYKSGMRGSGQPPFPESELTKLQLAFRSDFVTKGFINKKIAKELTEKFEDRCL